jgi:cytochrome P450
MSAVTERPTQRPTIDFDHFSQHYLRHWERIASDLHATGLPLAWSDHHDGFWVLASWDGVHEVARDWERFTSVNDLDGTENGGKGQAIPRMSYRLYLGESDPPVHTARRRLEVPWFTPKALRRWRPAVERHLLEAVNEVIERGEADLVADVIVPTAARTTLYVLGYDSDDWQTPAAVAHKGVYVPSTDPAYPYAEQAEMRAVFRDMLTRRQAEPTDDLISALANGKADGEPLSLDASESMLNALVLGGFDTTIASTANAILWLDEHPDEWARLREDAAVQANAVEEFLRVWPPATLLARTALVDTELLGVPIAAGERVGMWLAGANRDPRKFPDPDVVDLDRSNAREHVAFSAGPHRCLGSPLAKIELQHMLAAIPALLPDLVLHRERLERYPTIGAINGISHLPVTFTAGSRLPVDPEA